LGTTSAAGLGVGAAAGDALAGEACASRSWVAATGWALAAPKAKAVGGASGSGAGGKTSAARVGPAAITTNPTRGRTAKVRREPAEGRSTILRGLAPAMEGGRLVRQSRKSG
jgi:hypothetical protein